MPALCMLPLMLMSQVANGDVLPYAFPGELPANDGYRVSVGGVPIPAIRTEKGSFVSFGMKAPVEIAVTCEAQPGEVIVRPLSAGIHAEIAGNTCRFRLPQPRNLSVEIDGDVDHPLFVFANPEEANPPSKDDPKVKYFEAGQIHEAGEIQLQDGETLYLEGGAVVHGVIRAVGISGVAIRGAGILDATPREKKTNMVVFRECSDVTLENVIVLNPFGWSVHLSGSEDIEISNVRVIGWRRNCDGLDIEYCRDVRVRSCFWRTSDDCVAIKALYPPGITGIPLDEMIDPETLGGHDVPRIKGDAIGDIEISESVLWNDMPGNAFEIGFELRTDTIRDIVLRDSDIIHVMRGAAFSIHNGDTATVEDVLLEDVRVEDVDELVDMYVGLSIYSGDCPEPYRRSNPERARIPEEHSDPHANDNIRQWFVPDAPGRPAHAKNRGRIRNILVRDVKVLTTPRSNSLLSGYDEEHGVSNVTFEGLEIDGEPVTSQEEAGFYLNHAQEVQFRTSQSKPADRE